MTARAPLPLLQGMIEVQAASSAPWSPFAQRLLAGSGGGGAGGGGGGGLFRWPRSGGHDDKAHPPIHPIKHYPGGDRDKEALFEFIVRHFLA